MIPCHINWPDGVNQNGWLEKPCCYTVTSLRIIWKLSKSAILPWNMKPMWEWLPPLGAMVGHMCRCGWESLYMFSFHQTINSMCPGITYIYVNELRCHSVKLWLCCMQATSHYLNWKGSNWQWVSIYSFSGILNEIYTYPFSDPIEMGWKMSFRNASL